MRNERWQITIKPGGLIGTESGGLINRVSRKLGSANDSFPDLSGSRSREVTTEDELGVMSRRVRRDLSDCKSLRLSADRQAPTVTKKRG